MNLSLETFMLLVPITGLIAYAWLVWKMDQDDTWKPPYLSMLFIFTNYGSLTVLLLAYLFSGWSVVASAITVYAMVVAPLGMELVARINYSVRLDSVYHLWAYRLSFSYLFFVPVLFIGLL